jgi:hypothetical protein
MDEKFEKYRNDPTYHAIVDQMVRWISQHGLTPYELREAAFCASVKFEMDNVRKFVHLPSDISRAMYLLDDFIFENEKRASDARLKKATGQPITSQG